VTTASPATGRALGLARVLVLSASADGGHVRAAQAVGENGSLGQLIVEGIAQTDIEPHPQHGPEQVEDHKAPSRHAERPREGLPDAIESRQELRDQERARAAACKGILPAPHARVRLDREPAHPLEDPVATSAPDLVPDEVA